MFLLTGTFLNDAGQTFPVRLYAVNPQHKLGLLRVVVPGREGLYEVLDDAEGVIYVAFPYNNGVSQAPTKVSIVHENRPALVDVVGFNPTGMLTWDRATGTAVTPDLKSFALFTLFPVSIVHVDEHAAFMRLISGSATTLAAIAGSPPAKGPRVTRNDWGLYGHLTFYGSPGGPGVYFTPEAAIENGDLVMQLGGKTVFIDRAPPIPAASDTPRTIWVLAANRRFLVSIPLHDGGGNYAAPATMYVHDRRTDTWGRLKSAGSEPQCRIFGPWLATRVRNLKVSGRYTDDNPGHGDESDEWVRYERPDVRLEYASIDSSFYIPGVFTLDNLVDGRRITLTTNEEDSEILDVRSDGLVLYRVNDEIFSAQIEGNKLSAPTLVVKDEDVPEVHWFFWSNAQVKAQPAAQPSPGR